MATWTDVQDYLQTELGAKEIDTDRLAVVLPPPVDGGEPVSMVVVHPVTDDPSADQVILRIVVAKVEDVDLPTALGLAGTASRGGLVSGAGTVLLTHSFMLQQLSAQEARALTAVTAAHLVSVLQQIRTAAIKG
ncbi:hypothetical protein [Demequina pelophila]|uniref:hypothetical protein n=1 Tax=Demequina pelophila TaxID=1638984 RepID=UPI00078512E7|nr:hypothetical protein [Demequina pelophila]